MDRRRFLFVFGGSTAGIVLAGQSLIAMPQRLALLASGSCSFCLGTSGVRSIAGIVGKPARICDLCVELLSSVLDGTAKPRSVRYVEVSASVTGEDPRVSALRGWLQSDRFRTMTPEAAAQLREQLSAKALLPEYRAQLEESATIALAAAPTDFSARLKCGDIFDKVNAHRESAAHYALIASAFRHQGFLLKSVAVNKQILKKPGVPRVTALHEIADLYASLGLERDAATHRRLAASAGPAVERCSFCDLPRTEAPTFTGLEQRVCEPCVHEAAALFVEHRA